MSGRACYLAFEVSSGVVELYRSSHGIDLDNSEMASPVVAPHHGTLSGTSRHVT